MKRSEMIRRLNSYFNYNDMAVYGVDTGEEVLSLIESLGMLPPLNKNISQGTDEAIRGLKWEPEDES